MEKLKLTRVQTNPYDNDPYVIYNVEMNNKIKRHNNFPQKNTDTLGCSRNANHENYRDADFLGRPSISWENSGRYLAITATKLHFNNNFTLQPEKNTITLPL